MAKMTKQQIEQAAVSAARAVRDAHLTFAEISLLTYEQRQARAAQAAMAYAAQQTQPGPAMDSRFASAFHEELLRVWARTVKAKENARREWRRLIGSKTVAQASADARQRIVEMQIRGAQISDGSGVTVSVTRGPISADLYVSFDADYDHLMKNPDNAEQRIATLTPRVRISWSGTSRTVAEATLALTIYRELAEAGAEIEAVLSNETVIRTFGFETCPECGVTLPLINEGDEHRDGCPARYADARHDDDPMTAEAVTVTEGR